MDTLVDAAIAFVSANRDWAGVIAFFFALAETIAVFSIIIPSTAILIGVGAVVATGALDFTPIWIGGALGSIAGSLFSYWLGWRYGPSMMRIWPLGKHPELAMQGTQAFARWGLTTILIGHFVGPLRAVVFLMAGVSHMNFPRFLAVNVVGATAWAWAIPKSGEIGGNVLLWIWNAVTGA
ncbi:DedA family protein [Gemmobacter nectariphilus]|uniref:DedA family protein n=1 Tax=Gemmobacter nectariphilus TaxID=220343 RepID=UPI00041E40B4|nr:DedA family protein [Gemmobacter nectariphilus]